MKWHPGERENNNMENEREGERWRSKRNNENFLKKLEQTLGAEIFVSGESKFMEYEKDH